MSYSEQTSSLVAFALWTSLWLERNLDYGTMYIKKLVLFLIILQQTQKNIFQSMEIEERGMTERCSKRWFIA